MTSPILAGRRFFLSTAVKQKAYLTRCNSLQSLPALTIIISPTTVGKLSQQQQHLQQQQQRSFHRSNFANFATIRRRRRGSDGSGIMVPPRPPPPSDDDDGTSSTQSSSSTSIYNSINEKNPRHIFVTDLKQFTIKSEEFLNNIEESVQHMKQCNDIFIIKRLPASDDTPNNKLQIDLAPIHGNYYFDVDIDNRCCYYQSPISGKYTYVLSDTTHDFISEDDEHSLKGIFVRDIIRQCNGYPKL